MIHNLINKLRSVRMGLALILALFMAVTSWAKSESISYIDADGTEKYLEPGSYTLLDTLLGGDYGQPDDKGYINLPGGWYVVSNRDGIDAEFKNTIRLGGDVHLVLMDGAEMWGTVENGSAITYNSGGRECLTVYGQAKGSGLLHVENSSSNAILVQQMTINGGAVFVKNKTGLGVWAYKGFYVNGGTVQIEVPKGESSLYSYEIKLGWRNIDDFISFSGPVDIPVNILDGFAFIDDDGVTYSGVFNEDNSNSYVGKTLRPYYLLTIDNQNGTQPETIGFDPKKGDAIVKEPKTPKRLDADFVGWSTTANGGELIDWKNPFVLTRSTTLYAQWNLKPVEYIDENGDVQSLKEYIVLDDLEKMIKNQMVVLEGGRIKLPGGQYVVLNEKTISEPVDFTGDVQLVIADGATLTVSNDKTSNEFVGTENFTVYGQKDGSGIFNIDVFEVRKTLTTNNIHLNSKNYIKSFESYFVFNGGSLNAAFLGKREILRWNKGTDFVYVGVYDPSCSSSTAIDEDTPFVDEKGNIYKGDISSDVDFDGKMLKPAFAIDVDYQDGRIMAESFAATFDEKSNAFFVKEPPSEPTRDDAKFLGWSTTATGEINAFDWKEPVKQNTKVYARWEQKPVKYVDENGKPQTITRYFELSNLLKMIDNGLISAKYGNVNLSGGWYVFDGAFDIEKLNLMFNGDAHVVLVDKADIKLGRIYAYSDISVYAGVALNKDDDPVVGSGVLNVDYIYLYENADFNGGQLKCSKIHAYSLIAINGGVIEAEELVYANLSLGWHNVGDLITVNKYTKRNENSELTIADGKTFIDKGKNVYSGTLTKEQIAAIQGASLTPCYTLTLVLPDGSVLSTEIASFDKNGDAWAEVPYLERPGIKFLGWYTMPDGETKVEMGSISITRNTTLYAKLGVEYVDKNGVTQLATQYTVLNDVLEKLNDPDNTEYVLDKYGELNLPGGTYVVVPDGEGAKVEFANTISFNGDVLLIVADGAEMFVLDKKSVYINGNLDIYGQNKGSGKLKVDNMYVDYVSINNVQVVSEEYIGAQDVRVYGGSLDLGTLKGDPILGWSNPNNSIKVQEFKPSCSSSIAIADGEAFVDEWGQIYSGDIEYIYVDEERVSPLNGKKLTPSYAVAFDLRDGSPAKIVAATFDEKLNGFVVDLPKAPARFDGVEFLGWYTADGDEIDGSNPVVITKNTTIYAKWNLKPVKYVDAKGETLVIENYFMLSNGMTLPYDESQERYSFSGGWYVVPNSNPEGVDLSLEKGIIFNGDAHLILEDGAEMNLSKGRTLEELFESEICAVEAVDGYGYYGLSIYAGSFAVKDDSPVVGSGILSAEGVAGYNVTLNGGHVNATMVGYLDKVAINSGVTEISAIMGMDGDVLGVVLDWRSFEDRITVENYSLSKTGTLAIADGKYFKDEDGKVYSGTIELDQNGGTVLDGKTLIPTLSLEDKNVVVADIPRQMLTESAPCPEVVVKDGEKTLELNKDYLAECVDNEAASATAPYVKITGTGIYAGEIEKHFEIWEKAAEYAAISIYNVGDNKLHAVIDGNFGGELADVLTEDVKVESIEFNREFPKNAYSTVVLPFDVNTNDLEGVLQVLAFDGLTVDEKGQKAVGMKEIWSADGSAEHVDLKAYTPYIMLMSGENLVIKSGVTLKKMEESVAVVDGWALQGTLEYKKWEENDPEIGLAYGFAAGDDEALGVKVGDFVKVAAGAWINPMRAYLVKVLPKKVAAHGAYVTPVPSIAEELPDRMSIVIVKGDKNGEGVHTTVIGQFNTRASGFRMNFVPRTYDLKGRSVGEGRKARGVYLKK